MTEAIDDERDDDGELADAPAGPGRFERWVDGRRARRAERAEVALPDPPTPPGVLVRAADHHVPTRTRAAQVARVYVPPALRATAWSPLTLPVWLLRQCWYVLRGLGALLANRREWIRQPERRAGLRAEGIDPTVREQTRTEIEQRGAGRNRTWSLAAVMLLAAVVAVTVWNVYLGAALVLAGLARLDYLGRQPIGNEPAAPEAPLAPSPIRTGMSLGSVRSQLIEGALALGFDMSAQRPRPFVRGEGFDVRVQTQHPLDPATLRDLERRVQIPQNSITIVVDAADSSVRDMRITLSDPLSDMPGRDEPEFDSLSVREPALCGLDETGRPYREVFSRSHVQIVGKSGSGKSSALWRFLRLVAAWNDATCDGIDLTRGPAFSALRGVLTRRGFTYEDACAILRDRKAEAEARIARLGEIADSDDEQYDDADENHVPTPDEPQRFVAIDEFHAFASASRAQAAADGDKSGLGDGLELVEWFLRYARKAAVTLVMSGQGSKGTDTGTTTIRDLITIVILFACDSQDVLRTLGKDARDAGWRPDLLLPAQDDNVRDAGKCYTQSGENDDSGQRRWYRYSLGEVRQFARAYRAYTGDTAPTAEVDAVVVPEVLQAVVRLAAEHGVDRVPSEVVATALGSSQTLVAEAMRPHRVSTHRDRCSLAQGRTVACYRVAEVQAAIDRL